MDVRVHVGNQAMTYNTTIALTAGNHDIVDNFDRFIAFMTLRGSMFWVEYWQTV